MLLRHMLCARPSPSRPGSSSVCTAASPLLGSLTVLALVSALACTRTETTQWVGRNHGVDPVEAARAPYDLDGDDLEDALEDDLAERFAPIVFHGERESTFPTNVDRWL